MLYMVLFDTLMRNIMTLLYTAVPASFESDTPGNPPPQGHPFNPVSTVLSSLTPLVLCVIIHTSTGQFVHASSGRCGGQDDYVSRTTNPNSAHQQLATAAATTADSRREPHGLQETSREPGSSEESHIKNVNSGLSLCYILTHSQNNCRRNLL